MPDTSSLREAAVLQKGSGSSETSAKTMRVHQMFSRTLLEVALLRQSEPLNFVRARGEDSGLQS
jgi:hypothetical protein